MLTPSGGIALIKTIAACLLAILFHEMFHIIAARIFDVALYAFRPSAIGIRARLKGRTISFKKQIMIFIAGPLGNLLLALIFYKGSGFFYYIFESNLAIGLFNLLPMYPLDGAQIFIIVFYKLIGSNKTFKLVKKISLIVKIGLAIAGLIQILVFLNPSLLVAAVLLPGTRYLEETVSMMKLENLLNRKQRIASKGIYPARHLIAMNECTLGDVLQKLDYDRFHIIYIMNEDMEIVGQITEQQIIKAMQTCGSEDKICDVFFLGI
jgi:stage IV sporulation protein FB